MKFPQPNGARGSMGIPPEIHPDQVFGASKKEQPSQKEEVEEGETTDPLFSQEAINVGGQKKVVEEEPPVTDETARKSSPLHLLKSIGIELTEDDFSRLLFKGFIEKTVPISFVPGKQKKALTATLKTLTGEEYDLADELLGEEMRTKDMTRDGFEIRRSIWLLAFGCTRLNDTPIVKPVMSGDELDLRATVVERRKVLRALSPAVLNKMTKVFSIFTSSVDRVVEDPEKAFLEKP